MEAVISLIILIFIIIWAVRVETGINKLNETLSRIERHLEAKKEKK
jgi:hypothetical protein